MRSIQLTEDHHRFRRTVRDVVERKIAPHADLFHPLVPLEELPPAGSGG